VGIGPLIGDLLLADGWPGAEDWISANRDSIAPTIVGGSKKHGGADLGPTRAKAAWARLGVDGHGLADAPPASHLPRDHRPRLTTEMVSRIQGWLPADESGNPYRWDFHGRKTSCYRQIGNAFPPPVARAIGTAVAAALRHEGRPVRDPEREQSQVHDPVLLALQAVSSSQSLQQLSRRTGLTWYQVEQRIEHLTRDFDLTVDETGHTTRYALRGFRGFLGQADHARHDAFDRNRSSIS
jgi:DNA (cytosine-5)-methyltransferase 1